MTRFNHTKTKHIREEKKVSFITCGGMNAIKNKFKDLQCYEVSKVHKCVLKVRILPPYTASNPFSKTECKFPGNKNTVQVHLDTGCSLTSFVKIGAVTMFT